MWIEIPQNLKTEVSQAMLQKSIRSLSEIVELVDFSKICRYAQPYYQHATALDAEEHRLSWLSCLGNFSV